MDKSTRHGGGIWPPHIHTDGPAFAIIAESDSRLDCHNNQIAGVISPCLKLLSMTDSDIKYNGHSLLSKTSNRNTPDTGNIKIFPVFGRDPEKVFPGKKKKRW